MVRTSTEVIGICQLAADWEDDVKGEVMTDSAAALGVTRGKGCGKLRHNRVGNLWVQEKQESGELGYRKTEGSTNPADIGTKYLAGDKIDGLMERVLQAAVPGRAELSLKL